MCHMLSPKGVLTGSDSSKQRAANTAAPLEAQVRLDALELVPAKPLLLLLPVTMEHTIDERSPLFGHTSDSLTVREDAV